MKLLLFIVSFVLAFPVWAKEPFRSIDATVVKVADGDTITAVDSNGTKLKVRLYGIDAPETEKRNKRTGLIIKQGQPYGEESYAALVAKVSGRKVKLDVMDVDKYKRLVCLIYMDGVNINEYMVAGGHAWAYRKYLSEPYKSRFIDAETAARSKRLGLWKLNNPEPPWEFRKRI